jgi:hypothetical protein
MSEDNFSAASLLEAKYRELKDSPFSKYFFLYFLHLLGHFNYSEENGESVFTAESKTLRVPLPVIDSAEKYKEMENIHNNLASFFEFLKQQGEPVEAFQLNLLENI